MIRNALRIAMLSVLALPFTGSEASAQGLGIHFGKPGKFQVSLNLPLGRRHRSQRAHRARRSPPRHRHSRSCRQWQPGRVETIYERVWVPGRVTRRWCPPVYRTSYDRCGNPIQVLVRAGYYETHQEPGCYRNLPRTIRHPGQWIYTCGY